MNEIALSSDINVLTAEINSYKQIAGQSIWEIGRRLNYVKEHDLAHGEFINWVNSLGIDEREAQRFMKVSNEIPNTDTWSLLGSRALYLIATLPEEERSRPHETAKGETKTPDEMTVRELQELKKQLKQKDEQIERLENIEPVEVTIEKVPDDYYYFKGNYEATKKNSEFYKNQNEELRSEIKQLENQIKSSRVNNDEAEAEKLQQKKSQIINELNSIEAVISSQKKIETFISEVSSLTYTKDFINISAHNELIESFEVTLEFLEKWIQDVKTKLPNKNIIEGDLILDEDN
ncbi:DUF3102 domain-containing protein [Lactococcus lactis]|uniref:DUF3102 domain-containing protein n=1 Tax=Lactococcus lactis TaxID=1358 RepID=A0A6M0M9T7_9LACT|nr:DUF3102 domain-containing protein [Lactococcus lactis]MCT1174413.1 DUF3102 domain-containing protein [Lactococcus lactis]NEX50966.1 DUF3102 domain-containing protein [Lactococcus lactis]NEX56190.1 DUF3102 domain-containing protein [Lactococcus lactis]